MAKRLASSPRGPQLSLISPEHRFGGDWTEEKLTILEDYLKFYLVALKKQKFYFIYIDAFAGTGYRNQAAEGSPSPQTLIFDREGKTLDETKPTPKQTSMAPESIDSSLLEARLLHEDSERLLAGSVVRALRLEPGFSSYHFIERDAAKVAHLRSLKETFGKKQFVHHGDANDELLKLIGEIPWGRPIPNSDERLLPKAVLFLDPYGMKVKWSTLERVAATQHIDVWYLVPVGIGLNRMLPKNGEINPTWRECLNETLGTADWYEHFYTTETVTTLFGNEQKTRRIVGLNELETYVTQRLKTLFMHVSPHPRRLCNSKGYPMYSFFFACNHPRGGPLGEKVANELLNRL